MHNIIRQQLVVERAVAKDIDVSESDIEKYFDQNHATLDKGEQIHARHILVADEKTALLVESKLKAGEKFDALAAKYSVNPGSKDKGGDLGFFGKGQMVPVFEKAAFALQPNQISAPVKSPFGYHIIQLIEHKPAEKATFASSARQDQGTADAAKGAVADSAVPAGAAGQGDDHRQRRSATRTPFPQAPAPAASAAK